MNLSWQGHDLMTFDIWRQGMSEGKMVRKQRWKDDSKEERVKDRWSERKGG